jgi:hypothetical protein
VSVRTGSVDSQPQSLAFCLQTESSHEGIRIPGLRKAPPGRRRRRCAVPADGLRSEGCNFDPHRPYQLSSSVVRACKFCAWAEVGNKTRIVRGRLITSNLAERPASRQCEQQERKTRELDGVRSPRTVGAQLRTVRHRINIVAATKDVEDEARGGKSRNWSSRFVIEIRSNAGKHSLTCAKEINHIASITR